MVEVLVLGLVLVNEIRCEVCGVCGLHRRRAFIGKGDWATRVFRLKERGSCRIGSVRLNWAGELASFQAREQSRLAVRSCTKEKG